ncbi:MAG: cyclic nucleotide-binding domain-containing protein [Proteobacteria bacterium]|nr:cyclic nucleotide-binding domain-containing protein [Pseudomonadota bacterium]
MGRSELRRRKDRAAEAVRCGHFSAALEIYADLGRAEPSEPDWPRRRADVFRRMDRPEQEIEALERAAELYASAGFAVQAIAAYKRIIGLDAERSGIRERLVALLAQRGLTLPGSGTKPRIFGRTRKGAPLDELILTDVVPDSQPAQLLDGAADIPLDNTTGAHTDSLRTVPLFGSLDEETLRHLLDRVRLVSLSEGEVLFRQGDPADALYVVAEGAVVPIAEPDASSDRRVRLAVLDEGEFFGEIGLVTNRPRNATVEAIVDTRLLSVDRAVMWSLIEDDPRVFKTVLRFLRKRLIDRLVRTSPIFAAFARAERGEIAGQFRLLEVKDGTVLIEQDHPAPGLLVLLAGQLQVIFMAPDGDKVLATLGPGEFCGERSLLQNEPTMAGVVASGKCWVLALPEPRFQRILSRHPQLRDLIERVAAEREQENETTLRQGARHGDGDLELI